MSNKDIDKYRRDQEIQKAAELKAKLDMVSTRDKARYGRQTKKIGTMVCDTGFKTGYRNSQATFVLRLNDEGEFIAEHGDTWYVSKSRDALKAKMDQVAKVTFDLKWSRYLVIKYNAVATGASVWNRCQSHLELGRERHEDITIIGMTLEWETVEFSDAVALPDGERFMKRDVSDDGEPSDDQESINKLPDGLVPYTKEREEALVRIRAAIAGVDAKMVALFGGAPADVGRKLDAAVDGQLLLEASKPKPASRSKR